MLIFKKEKEVIKLIIRHVDKVEESVLTALKTLEAYLGDVVDEAKRLARETDKLETQADLIRHNIRDKLYSGAYLPILREDIYKLVESLDKVANAGEACCDFFLNQRPVIPEDFKSHFLVAVRESLGIIEPLKEAVMCFIIGECPVEVTRQHSKTVGLKESDADKIEWDLTKVIFKSSLGYGHKIHLKLCLDSIMRVSDRAEKTADQLELATVKSTMV